MWSEGARDADTHQTSNLTIADIVAMDLLNSKKTITSKIKHKQPNPRNLTLAERILANRKKGKSEPRSDSASGSVDISELTNQRDDRDDRRSPTPEPTVANNRKSPLKRQDTRRTLNDEPGPSNRKSATPPLPPIKSETPRPETKQNNPSRATRRKETPVLPPIARNDSVTSATPPPKRESVVSKRNKSRTSILSDDGIREVKPPKDTREFDPNLGVGVEDTPMPTPVQPPPKQKSPEVPIQEVKEVQETIQEETAEKKPDTPKPKTPVQEAKKAPTPKPKTPSPERPKQQSPERSTQVVPVVAAAAANTASQRPRSRSQERSRSRSRKRSRSRSRSRRRRSRSRHRSRSRSRSRKRTRSRKSRSRKRRSSSSSTSYTSSSSPKRRRRHSYSPRHRHHSRGRSKTRRSSSFDYDFERAKSIVRSISRMGSLTRPRYRSPSLEYKFIGGGPPGYWPPHQSYSPRRKKKIIIVQNGMPEKKKTRRSRVNSDSDSDVSVVIKGVTPRTRKSKQISSSEESESSESRSRSREKKRTILKESKNKTKQTTKVKSNKNTKQKKKQESGEDTDEKKQKNIRFDLNNVKGRRFSKSKAVEIKQDSTPEPQSDTATPEPEIPKLTAKIDVKSRNEPVQEQREDVHASVIPTLQGDISDASSRNQTPTQRQGNPQTPLPKQNINKKKPDNSKPRSANNDDQELLATLEQLDKRADFELEQLKGGNQRKLPPDVNLAMKKKIFSTEFQRNIDSFLES